MACGACGSKKPAKETWVHTAPDGTKKTYAAEPLAKAAKARLGGTYAKQ
jgi:hypothetical protein